VRVRLGSTRFLGLGHLGAQTLQLFVQRRLVRQQRRELFIPLSQPGFQLLELLDGLLRKRRGLGQRAGVEGQPRRRLGAACVGAGEPVAHMEQLADRRQRVDLLDGPMAVHGLVAERVDDPGLAEHRLARGRLEGRLVDQRAQVVLIRQTQRSVGLVRPRHRQLERPPGVEARRAWVRVYGSRGFAGRLVHGGPFCLQKGEVAGAHRAFSSASAWRSWPSSWSKTGGLLRNMGCIAS